MGRDLDALSAQRGRPSTPLGDVPIAVTMREGIIDCVHYGSAALVDSNGAVVWGLGSTERLVFERSTAKPFRALAVLRAGAIEALGLDDADIAVIAGSHSGTALHVARVDGILRKCGLEPASLRCGVRLPLGRDGILELVHAKMPLSCLHCDCSGEHAGALALCRHRGYDLESYTDADHPVQREFAATAGDFLPASAPAFSVVRDRCGMPTSAIPLGMLAYRLGRLMQLRSEDESVARLTAAITANPLMYAGKGRLVGELIVRAGGAIIAKDGAEGLYTIGWLDAGLALAVKVADGGHRAALPVLEQAARIAGLAIPSLWDCLDPDAFAAVSAVVLPPDVGAA